MSGRFLVTAMIAVHAESEAQALAIVEAAVTSPLEVEAHVQYTVTEDVDGPQRDGLEVVQ